jgi:hypothetical protein
LTLNRAEKRLLLTADRPMIPPMEHFKRAVISWVLLLAALLAVGPFCASLIGGLEGSDGGLRVTPITSTTPIHGITMALAGLAGAAVVGVISARLLGIKSGLSMAGLVVAWIAYRTGRPDAMLRRTQDAGLLYQLSLEGLIIGTAGVLLAMLIVRGARHSGGLAAASDKPVPHNHADNPRMGMLAGVGAAVVVAALLGWLLGFETLKLQALGAAVVAGIGAGVAAHLAGTALSPGISARQTVLSAFVAIAVLATVGPVSAFAAGSGGVLKSAYDGSFFGLAAPVPLDWLAGALLGAPIGLGWAGSMIDKRMGTH